MPGPRNVTLSVPDDDLELLEELTNTYRTAADDSTVEGAFVNSILCRLVNAARLADKKPIKWPLEGV